MSDFSHTRSCDRLPPRSAATIVRSAWSCGTRASSAAVNSAVDVSRTRGFMSRDEVVSVTAPTSGAMPDSTIPMSAPSRSRAFHTFAPPVLFLILLSLPLPTTPYAVRGGIGLLLWMSWWWLATPVDLAVTAFLPPVVVALCNLIPIGTVLSAYSDPLVFLLLGANMLSTLWQRWGLDRRIALVSFLAIGSSTRQQVATWFIVSAILSSVLPNAVVAATLMPVVIAMLRFLGVESPARSAFGSALLIAIAWGTAIGGAGTPLGGAHNLMTVQLLEQQFLHREFLFTTWVVRTAPLTILTTVASLAFVAWALTPEVRRVEGSRAYFAGELRALGPMSMPERLGLWFFLAAMLLSFTRQLYAGWLPGLTPAFVFLTFGVLSFAIRHNGTPLLEWGYAQSQMVW